MVLEVNIPIMQDELAKGVRVFIQDTPGFGATEHDEIKRKTALSMLSSSLLVYTISCKQLEDEKDAVTLKTLCEMDPSKLKTAKVKWKKVLRNAVSFSPISILKFQCKS